jgi:shikimate dehydrogenase
MIYAEVIGDPIAQSKSPLILKHWLERSGIEADYRATRVSSADLADFVRQRRVDPRWRGCNVTLPHKEAIARLIDRLDESAASVGAVNCVLRAEGQLVGFNTDVDGIAAALDDVELSGRKAAIIGGGGAARAALTYLAQRGPSQIIILVRDPKKAEPLRTLGEVDIHPIASASEALTGSDLIINASPLGMTGSAPMPGDLLDPVSRSAAGATLFDMVYHPMDTAFLQAGRAAGARTVDGLRMLVGQAARAFELFFRQPAPGADSDLRSLLTKDRRDSSGRGYKSSPRH